MVFKIVLLAGLISVAIASQGYHHHTHGDHQDRHYNHRHGHHGYHVGHQRNHADQHGHGYHGNHDYHHDNVDHRFKYDVKDDKTHNYQSRDEYKDGKNVYGSYSLVEPDGKVRIVKYKADDYGFQADVDYNGGYKHDYKPGYAHQDSYYKH